MKTVRHLLLALLFVGLVALEIGHGVFRLGTVRDDRHRELLAGIELRHSDLAREIRTRLEEERAHAAYLSRLPSVRGLLRAGEGDEAASRALEGDLLPYLVSFRGIDGIRVLDPRGRERFRCERIGKGVGALPRGLLDEKPDAGMVSLARDARPGEVVLSELAVDRRRVEVPESERQVLHFATSVEDGAARAGILVLTVYAAPLLNAVRSFTPLPGVRSSLVARDGTYLASTVRSRERGSPGQRSLRDDHADTAEKVLSGAEKVRTADALLLALPTGESNAPWRLVTYVPDAALDAASRDLRWEYTWVVGSMVLTTLAIVIAGAFLVRISIREVELREAARYEKQQQDLQRQMQVAERLGSLGLLTAGVAHEINNPLEGIENYLALLEREPLAPEKRKRYIEMVRYGFHRIRDIVRDLSAFARPNVLETTADLSRVVAHALRMVGYTKDFKGVRIHLDGLDSPLVVAGDPGRLEQVFINLLLNAAKAMDGSGEVRLAATQARAEEDGAPRVDITIDDTGPGIPQENLGRIFDPFFTTTDGTGLGLSISYGIIQAHGGTILAQNRKEGGARFTIRLPVLEPAAVARHGERSAT